MGLSQSIAFHDRKAFGATVGGSVAKSVYVALVEVRPLPGCEMDPREINGAFVRCFVIENNEERATRRILASLMEDAFEIVDLEWLVDDISTEWDNPDDDTDHEFMAEAENSGEVVYGIFHTWGHDAPDANPRPQ
jgi:hypothetical protein